MTADRLNCGLFSSRKFQHKYRRKLRSFYVGGWMEHLAIHGFRKNRILENVKWDMPRNNLALNMQTLLADIKYLEVMEGILLKVTRNPGRSQSSLSSSEHSMNLRRRKRVSQIPGSFHPHRLGPVSMREINTGNQKLSIVLSKAERFWVLGIHPDDTGGLMRGRRLHNPCVLSDDQIASERNISVMFGAD
ncbi:hypothetical protein B0H19DRAFT_1065666 [Mycena capillaripes]|nr:hypothetical protein B0H19DRAFT_1065666 [Mycena capillaripes]